MNNFKVGLLTGLALAVSAASFAAETTVPKGEVNVYNWTHYIAKDTLAGFEKQSGIKVNYDLFDTNELLESKLLTGRAGYDVVVPSGVFLANQIKAGVYQPLKKDQITNLKNLNPVLMKKLEAYDPGNQFAIPYLWGTVGIGYNPDMVKKALGEEAPVDSWDLVFKPENMKKLQSCGVAFLDDATEVYAVALNYLGMDPNSKITSDYSAATDMLSKVSPYVTYFSSSRFVSDLANGDICVTLGYSGGIFQAETQAKHSGNGININYMIPKEGAPVWFDMMAIPKDSPNPENAHTFVNYILEPKVTATITNEVSYANGNDASKPFVDKTLRNNSSIYPTDAQMETLFLGEPHSPQVTRVITRSWNRVKTGR